MNKNTVNNAHFPIGYPQKNGGEHPMERDESGLQGGDHSVSSDFLRFVHVKKESDENGYVPDYFDSKFQARNNQPTKKGNGVKNVLQLERDQNSKTNGKYDRVYPVNGNNVNAGIQFKKIKEPQEKDVFLNYMNDGRMHINH